MFRKIKQLLENSNCQTTKSTASMHVNYRNINHIGGKPNNGQFFRACLLRYRSIKSVL